MRLISIRPDERGWFAAILSLALGQSAAALITAWAVKELFDSFLGRHHQHAAHIGTIVLVFAGTAIGASLIEAGKRRAAAELSLRRAQFIRLTLFRHIINNPHVTGQRTKGGTLLPFVGDLTTVRRWIGEALGGAASAAILVPVLLIAIGTRDLVLACALFVILLCSFGGSLFLLASLDRAVREVRRRRGGLTAFIIGRVEAAGTIYVSGREKAETRKVEARINGLSEAERRRALILGCTGGVASISRSALVLCTVLLGFYEARGGRITAGSVAGILTLVHLLSGAVTDLVRAFEAYRPAKVAYERIDRVLGTSPSQSAVTGAPAGGGEAKTLQLCGVSVPGQLQHISGQASHGSVVLIDGASGSGKSALLRTIAQLARPSRGNILYGGQELRNLPARDRARFVGYASTDLALLPGSLGMNLLARSKVADEDLRSLAAKCGLSRLIGRLPDGLKGRLTGTLELSVGERQGIALVRALAGSPPLLLLDAIDSNLDTQVLDWVSAHLKQYPGIVLMVACTEALRRAATMTWWLDAGVLKEIKAVEEFAPGDGPKVVRFPVRN